MTIRVPYRKEAAFSLVLLVPLLLHLWTLMRLPPPFLDEVWLLSRAWGYVQTGRVFGDLDRGVFDYFEGYWTVLPWLPIFLKSLFLRFSTVPSLFAIRLATLLFGFILLLCLYLIACSLGGHRLAIPSVLLTSLSPPFLLSAHVARTDVEAATFGYLAIALYFLNRTSRLSMAFLCGFAVTLAYQCHPHGIVLAPPIVALYFWHQRWAMVRQRAFWGFVGGGLFGALLFVLWHVLPYPDAYFNLMALNFGPTHIPPILTLNPAILGQAFVNMGRVLLESYPTLTLLLLALLGVGLTVARRTETDKTILVLTLSTLLSHTLLIREKISYYTILSSPMLDLLAAYFLVMFFSQSWRTGWKATGARVAVIGLASVHVSGMLFAFTFNFYSFYEAAQRGVSAVVDEDDTIMGPQPYWLQLYDHSYYPWEALVYYRRYDPDSTLEQAMARFKPDIFIIDSFMRNFIVDDPRSTSYLGSIHLPRTALERFLAERGELLTEFENDVYGPIQVYRLRWE